MEPITIVINPEALYQFCIGMSILMALVIVGLGMFMVICNVLGPKLKKLLKQKGNCK